MNVSAPIDSDVLAARSGDRTAFGRLVARYGSVVTSISLSTVGNVATSEEIAQDVFLTAWRDLATLRNPSSFLPWLRQLTRHRALDVARSGRRPDRRAGFDEATLAAVADPRPDAEHALLHDERAEAVSAALDALPADAREVLVLFYREGGSVAQVARLLGLREDTVKKRLSRARAALREEVLAGFADAVEATAPGEAFAQQVMIALPVMSPAAALVAGKAVLHLVAKWAVLAGASAAGLAGVIGGGVPILGGMRKDLAIARDDRERREIRQLGIAAVVNVTLFSLGIPALKAAVPAQARLGGIVLTLGFTAVHLLIYCVLVPRAKSRRRQAEEAHDPARAEVNAREDRSRTRWAIVASGIILTIVVAAWIR